MIRNRFAGGMGMRPLESTRIRASMGNSVLKRDGYVKHECNPPRPSGEKIQVKSIGSYTWLRLNAGGIIRDFRRPGIG